MRLGPCFLISGMWFCGCFAGRLISAVWHPGKHITVWTEETRKFVYLVKLTSSWVTQAVVVSYRLALYSSCTACWQLHVCPVDH